MLKMILDPMGGILCVFLPPLQSYVAKYHSGISLTNDGNAILREIDVAHPAAKNMIELSRTQDEECGDGTTSVIILGAHVSLLNISPHLHSPSTLQLERSSRNLSHNWSGTSTLS